MMQCQMIPHSTFDFLCDSGVALESKTQTGFSFERFFTRLHLGFVWWLQKSIVNSCHINCQLLRAGRGSASASAPSRRFLRSRTGRRAALAATRLCGKQNSNILICSHEVNLHDVSQADRVVVKTDGCDCVYAQLIVQLLQAGNAQADRSLRHGAELDGKLLEPVSVDRQVLASVKQENLK